MRGGRRKAIETGVPWVVDVHKIGGSRDRPPPEEEGATMPKQDIIVCAVDGSDASKTAAKWAANTAVKRGIPLRRVSSYSMPQFLYAEGMVPPQELYEDLEAETLEKIEEAKKVAVDFVPGVDVSHQIEEGSPI